MSIQSSGPRRVWGRCAGGLLIVAGMALLMLAITASAEVTGITYTTTSPMFGGTSFGTVGQYEQLDGTVTGELDPDDEHNEIIQDIKRAPRNAHGKVQYSMTFSLLKPIDLSKSNHMLIYDVVNRGNKVITGTLNVGGSATAAGDGFLEKQGFILVWSGWQADVLAGGGRQTLTVPVAHHRDGSSITGEVRQEYTLASAAASVFLAGSGGTATASIATATLNNSTATLTMRVHQDDPKVLIPNSQWAFADCSTTPFPGVPSTTHACLQGGFDTNHIYELVYTGTDPLVFGIGFAATRDLVAFLRGSTRKHHHHDGDDKDDGPSASAPVNPLAGAVHSTIGFGVSQSGRYLRTLLDLGFNEDENGNRVFDGLDPEIASYRISLNIRFAQPTRLSGTQHTEKQFPGQESPTTWGDSHDEFSHITGGLLDRCRESHTCPKVFNTVSSTEYWQAGMWATTEDSDGDRDLDIPDNVRIYHWSSTQHGGSQPAVAASKNGICEQLSNLNSYTYNFRALLLRLRDWVVNDREPPHSRYASLRNGKLVPASHVNFPTIPGVTFVGNFNSRQVLDRGPKFDSKNDSGVMDEPPVVRHTYRELLPKVNDDGNEVDGVRSTQLRAPLGTYSGWNTRANGFGHPDLCDLTGQYIPFAVHKADRLASGDPRLSLEERYGSKAGYIAAVTQAIQDQLDEGLLLPDDAVTILSQENARNIGLP